MTSFFLAMQEMFNVENVVMLLTAVAAFATILTLTAPMLAGDKLGTRMKYVSTEREAMRAKARENLAQEKTRLRQTSKGFIKDVVERFARGNVLENTAIKDKLRQAGFRGPGPMYTFVFFRFVMPPILFVLALLYLAFVNDFGLPVMSRFAASCGAAFVGFYLPSLFVENIIARRQDSIRKAFPDALDLLLICVESGMSIEAAFQKVAAEIGTQSVRTCRGTRPRDQRNSPTCRSADRLTKIWPPGRVFRASRRLRQA